jgi:gamma-glutamylcyclotransferase (GGCT)/AIG2-like uncharacterized protein YtfP
MQQPKQNKQFNVFCYGTLEFDAVMQKITGTAFPAEPATLIDYVRYMVKGAPYPAIIHEPGAVTEGTLFRGLNTKQMQMMDEYEGSLYDRIESEVLASKGELIVAQIYVVPLSRQHYVSRLAWNKADFELLYLKSFCKTL